MTENQESFEQRKDAVAAAARAGEPFPDFKDRIPGEERSNLEALYELLYEDEDNLPSLIKSFASELYEPEEKIGSGGCGTVYRGRNKSTNGLYAIKVLNDEFAIERRWREGRAGANIDSPYVVRYHHIGDLPDGRSYLVMDLVDGYPLSDSIKTGKLPKELTASRWMKQICEGMAAAQNQQVVHRDLKPSNILMRRDRRALICDFGLASRNPEESARPDAEEKEPGGLENESLYLTRTGAFLGTIAYVAPEQARNSREATDLSDIYSFGATFYHLLTGSLPTGDLKANEILQMHKKPSGETSKPEYPRDLNSNLSPEICYLIMRCLENAPPRRFQSFADILDYICKMEAPDIAHGRSKLGYMSMNEGDFISARKYFSEVIERWEYSSRAWFYRGEASLKGGYIDGAINDFTRAITLSPHFAKAYALRGEAYQREGNVELAEADFNKAEELKGIAPPWH